MSKSESEITWNPVRVEAHEVLPPMSVSREARTFLSTAAARPMSQPYPPLEDKAGWKSWIAATEQAIAAMMATSAAQASLVRSERIALGSVPCFELTPPDVAGAAAERVYLDIHGGAFILGGGERCRMTGSLMALRFGVRTYSPDYRMPPDHPFPAALDDCLAVYRALLERYAPAQIVVGGVSAGGNLAAALALALRARAVQLALPAGLVLLTPEVDLTESGDSFQILRDVDVVLRRGLAAPNALYANGHPLDDPHLSPLFGDFSRGFPRTFLQAGTRDLFLSNTVRMHRALLRAGIEAELHVFEGMPHGGFFGAPEDQELAEAMRRFATDCWERAAAAR